MRVRSCVEARWGLLCGQDVEPGVRYKMVWLDNGSDDIAHKCVADVRIRPHRLAGPRRNAEEVHAAKTRRETRCLRRAAARSPSSRALPKCARCCLTRRFSIVQRHQIEDVPAKLRPLTGCRGATPRRHVATRCVTVEQTAAARRPTALTETPPRKSRAAAALTPTRRVPGGAGVLPSREHGDAVQQQRAHAPVPLQARADAQVSA